MLDCSSKLKTVMCSRWDRNFRFQSKYLAWKRAFTVRIRAFFYLTFSCQYTVKHCIHEHVFFFFGQINGNKVSDIIIYIMKIMWRDFKKFLRVVSEIYKKALKVQILNEVALTQVVRKRVIFQDCKNENTSKFPSIKIWH